ncbi:MAG: maltotransferase domain-containing protein, partial [Streptosporangiaceae bacterium]
MIGRIPILDVEPAVDCGSRPAKAVTGEAFGVSATVFREGHGVVGVGVVLRDPARSVSQGRPGPVTPMRELAPGTDRYGADVTVTCEGLWRFHVEAWADPIASWHHDAAIKIPAGQDVELMLTEGALLFERAARRIPQPPGAARPAAARTALRALVARMRDRSRPPLERFAGSADPAIAEIVARWPLRELVTRSKALTVQVDRQRALYGAWYEFFPRSEGARVDPAGQTPPVSGTFRIAAGRLDAVAAMGFDVVYLPPVHPIGVSFRKGRNNTLTPQPGDPGSPWAIGSADGGNDAIHPDLGTFEDFDAFVARTRELGMEVALDLALNASPDHPWVKKHPEWFTT